MIRWLRHIAVAVTLIFVMTVTASAAPAGQLPLAGTPVYDGPVAAPEKSAPLLWRYQDLSVSGRWFSDQQVMKIGTEILTLEDMLAREKSSTARKVAEAQLGVAASGIPSWVWITTGIVVGAGVGVGVGWYVWKRNQSSSKVTPGAPPLASGLSIAW